MAPKSKPVAIFDIDGTIFRSSLFIEAVEAMINDGVLPESMRRSYSKEYQDWQQRLGPYDRYIEKMVRAFRGNIKGVKASDFDRIAEQVIKDLSKHTYRYTRDLITALSKSHFLLAISGSPSELVSKFCQYYGFDDFSSTVYEISDGRYTGVDARGDVGKDKIVQSLLAKHGLDLLGSIGVGDSEGDVGILSLVEKPIAFNPSSELFKLATREGWQIVVERKDVIYYYNHTSEAAQL